MQFGFLVAVAVVIFLTGFLGGAWALRGGLKAGGPGAIASLGAAAAAGIFLGAGFIHMLGDANDTFGDILPQMDFPLAYLIAAIGFVTVLTIERVVFRAASTAQGPFAYILTVVLGFHSLIAGIALGVEDHAVLGMAIAIAIVAHKGAAAFALGTSFVKSGMARGRAWGLITTFSCVTPLGIAVGALLGNFLDHGSGEVVEAVFDALAAGSFLYIAAIDIIHEEFGETHESHLPRLGALLAGLGLMALIALWT